jgi:hypothetical protein
MDQMVAHFDMLRNRNLLPNVPVRDGHPGFLSAGSSLDSGKVVGYHTSLRAEEHVSLHDQNTYTFLVADYEILDPAAMDAVLRGLWRNRSAEVGFWVTNDEAEFWPVYRGMAYVDLPAVEGLNSFSSPHHGLMFEKEQPVADPATPTPTPTPPPAPGQPAATPAAPVTQPPADPPAPQPQATHTAPAPVPSPATFTFQVNGAPVSDFTVVQNHITVLETFQRDTIEARRTDFVRGLADSNQILATQVDGLTTFALGLSPEQYEQWSKTFESAPTNPLLAQHGAQNGGTPPAAGTTDASEDETNVLRESVIMLRRSGMTEEKVMKTSSYKKLIKLDPTFSL